MPSVDSYIHTYVYISVSFGRFYSFIYESYMPFSFSVFFLGIFIYLFIYFFFLTKSNLQQFLFYKGRLNYKESQDNIIYIQRLKSFNCKTFSTTASPTGAINCVSDNMDADAKEV